MGTIVPLKHQSCSAVKILLCCKSWSFSVQSLFHFSSRVVTSWGCHLASQQGGCLTGDKMILGSAKECFVSLLKSFVSSHYSILSHVLSPPHVFCQYTSILSCDNFPLVTFFQSYCHTGRRQKNLVFLVFLPVITVFVNH